MVAARESPFTRARGWGCGFLVLGLAFACYGPALTGSMLWDDDGHLTKPALESFAGLARIWFKLGATQQYYPLLHSAFWLEHRLWGDSTLGYHIVNVLLHATSAILLQRVLRRLRFPAPAAWLAAVLFVTHPVYVESVAWISEQKNTLSTVFYLLAGLAYLRFDRERGRPNSARLYALSTLLFACALLSKTVTATLPAALLVVLWWQRGRVSRRDVAPLLPWFVMGVSSGLLTAFVERRYIGAVGASYDLTVLQRGLLASRIVWFYLAKFLWPTDLIFIYPRWNVGAESGGWILYFLAACAVSIGLWAVRGRSRGPLAAWLFFVGSLFPALGFFNVYPFRYSYVADHFQYLASLGLVALVASGTFALISRAASAGRWAAYVVVALGCAVLVVRSREQALSYADPATLYRSVIERNPESWMPHNNLGVLAMKDPKRVDEAIAEYEIARRLNPDDAMPHINLGSAWLTKPGRIDDAMAQFREALRLEPNNPDAHNNLGFALSKFPERRAEAMGHVREAIRVRPDYPQAHTNMGNLLADAGGHTDEALAEYREALRLKPDYPEAHLSLGNALSRELGSLPEAVSEYREALRERPDYAEAHNNLGSALLRLQGGVGEAIKEFQEALRERPDYPEAHFNLGSALLGVQGLRIVAISELEAAVSLKPDYPEALNNLGTALSAEGRKDEAVVRFEEALRLKPDFAEVHFGLAVVLLSMPGRVDDARSHLVQGLRYRPDDVAARKILESLPPPGP